MLYSLENIRRATMAACACTNVREISDGIRPSRIAMYRTKGLANCKDRVCNTYRDHISQHNTTTNGAMLAASHSRELRHAKNSARRPHVNKRGARAAERCVVNKGSKECWVNFTEYVCMRYWDSSEYQHIFTICYIDNARIHTYTQMYFQFYFILKFLAYF